METDGRYMMENNYRYSAELLDFCQAEEVPLHLRLVGGGVRRGRGVSRRARATSDRSTSTAIRSSCSTSVVRRRWSDNTAQVVGLRYFNVYGPREAHKGRMASVAFHFFNQYRAEGQGEAVRGQRRLRRRRAAARLRLGRRRGRR